MFKLVLTIYTEVLRDSVLVLGCSHSGFTTVSPSPACPSLCLLYFLQKFILLMLSGLTASSGKILVLLTSYQLGLKLLAMVPSAYTRHCEFEEEVLSLALSTKVPRLVAHVALVLLNWKQQQVERSQ